MFDVILMSHAGVTAVHGDGDAGDVAGGGGGQEDGGGVQLALVAVALLGDHGPGVGLEEVAVQGGAGQVGVEVAGADGVDGDAVLAPLGGQGAGEVDDAALGRVVGGAAGDLVAHQAVHGGDVDDAPVLGGDHGLLRHGPGHPEGAEQVDVHLVGELRVGDVLGGGDGAGPGVVDQDVDAAQLLQHRVHHGVDGLGVGDVAADGQSRHAVFGGDLGGHGLDLVLPPGHGHNARALIGQRLGHLHTQSAGAAGDNGHLAGEVKIVLHLVILRSL